MKTINEVERINALRKYNILDTLTEKDYEDVTFLASIICDVPIALISFVDENRQWFKSHLGIPASETLREYSFCAHAINSPEEVMIVEDSRIDERFKNNPLVTGDPNIVFYAGIPLINEEGFGLGTVCIIDRKTRKLSADQIKALKVLSGHVMHLLNLRRTNYELELLKLQLETRNKDLEQFAMVLSHDIKSPLTSVALANNLLKRDFSEKLGEGGMNLISTISKSANKIQSLVDGILSYYQNEKNSKYENIDLNEFFESLRNTISSPKIFTINYTTGIKKIFFNKVQLEQIFYNLINNSVRYNDKKTVEINVKLEEDNNFYKFSYLDNGIGIASENYEKIFDLFTTLSSADNFGLKGSGIGLATVKKIIENAGGNINVHSKLKAGTEFIFTIKKITN